MVKVLITGAAGQLGQSFADQRTQALQQGIELLLLDRRALDVTSPESIASVLDQYQPAVVVNTAAYTAVDQAEQEPEQAERLNAIAPGILAAACAQRGIWLVQISTDYVFDGHQIEPYQEQDPVSPLGVYGQTKFAGEQAVLDVSQDFLILRTSWVFSEFSHNFLKTMLRLAAERDQLGIVADQRGGPTYAPHIAQVVLQLVRLKCIQGQRLEGGVYHFAGQPDVSWYEFAVHIFKVAVEQGVLKLAPQVTAITTDAFPTLAKRPVNSSLSMARLHACLGNLQQDWQDGVEAAVRSLRSNV